MGTRLSNLSTTMRSELDRVMTGIKLGKSSNFYNIEMQFTATKNSAVSPYLTREIKSLTITQDYINNFTDKIIANLQLDQITYKALYYYRNELFCNLRFTEMNPSTGKPVSDTPLLSLKYRAILIDNQDIFKRVMAGAAEPAEVKGMPESDKSNITLRVRVELIDDIAYKSRKTRIHGIFTNVKMHDMIRYAVSKFGFQKAVIVKPDNDKTYTNFVIPPDYGVMDIMSFLQNAPGMGVYKNGFCSYVTDGTWFIYPRNGEGICKRVVHLYFIGENTIAGMDKMNWTEVLSDGDLCNHIILNSSTTERNWSPLGSENSANSANIQSAEAVLDYSRTLLEDDKFEARPVIRNIMSVPSDAVSEEDQVNMRFIRSNDNLFTIMSDLGALQQTSLTFQWESCTPFTFKPGTQVLFHYDHVNGYKTISGKCEKVTYQFKPAEHIRMFPVFSGSATVDIACNNFKAREDGNI